MQGRGKPVCFYFCSELRSIHAACGRFRFILAFEPHNLRFTISDSNKGAAMHVGIWLALGVILGAATGWAYGRAANELVIGVLFGVLAGAMSGLFMAIALPKKKSKKKPPETRP